MAEGFYLDDSTNKVHQQGKCDEAKTQSWLRIRPDMKISTINIARAVAQEEGRSDAKICEGCAATLNILPH